MYQLIICNCPDQTIAEQLAHQLVSARLAACVNILPAIEDTIKRLHPYEIPEIIALAIAGGSDDYLKWMDSCLHIA